MGQAKQNVNRLKLTRVAKLVTEKGRKEGEVGNVDCCAKKVIGDMGA